MMKHIKKCQSFWPILLIVVLILSISFITSSSQRESYAQEKAILQASQLGPADCIKCHPKVQETVDNKGSKHKSAISCMDCHRGHPPMVSKEKIIPVCSECHAGKPHYELPDCKSCHSDPHAPLEMKLAMNITGPCLTCHPGQGDELKNYPSLHTKISCTMCHRAHKEVPPCMTCHRPHTEEMINQDCLSCHPAHQPLTITYGQDMPSKYCAPCHQAISDKLVASQTKHTALACVFCHKDKHKMVPTCETCHGIPHPPAMVAKFDKCNACHISAHTLGKEANK